MSVFSQDEIDTARRLKLLGLPWSPSPGHFVFDEAGVIKQTSPFQEGVYFILDLRHFLRRTESLERLKDALTWLPTWLDARRLLRSRGITDCAVAETLRNTRSIEIGRELLTLYRLIEMDLEQNRGPRLWRAQST